MTWQYTIEWHQPRDATSDAEASKRDAVTRKNIVTVTSKPRSQMESSLITVATWTSASVTAMLNKSDDANATSTSSALLVGDFRPLSIFAQVSKGGNPIVGARVMMTLEIELGNGSSVVLAPVQLHDDGYGGENKL